jgi:hypothetical protein
MNRLLLILVLTFSFQTLSKADDIRDFQIEGMSVGDSLLSFMNKKYLNDNKEYFSSENFGVKKEYSWIFLNENKLINYDAVRVYFKSSDKKYLAHNISGYKYFKNDIAACKSFKNSIITDVAQISKDFVKKEYPYYELQGTAGTRDMTVFSFKDSSTIKLVCYDYKLDKYTDRFTLSLGNSVWRDFQENRSHK